MMSSSDGGKFFKNYNGEFVKMHKKNASVTTGQDTFDMYFKTWLVLKKFLHRRTYREQTLAFTFWRKYTVQFRERLKLTMNRLS